MIRASMRRLRRFARIALGWVMVAVFVGCVIGAIGCALLGRWTEAITLEGTIARERHAELRKLIEADDSSGNTGA